MLHVNEIFPTIQGEAFWTGMPATFVRLQGCPVGCGWCDTKHTWPVGQQRMMVSITEMLQKVVPAPTWAEMTPGEVVEVASDLQPRHFVITGGEPLAQDITVLTAELLKLGTVQVETSGTHPIHVAPGTWITVSPKLNMSGGLPFIDNAIDKADEVKMPVNSGHDIDLLLALLVGHSRKLVWLQPISQGDEATTMCVEACLKYGWRLSIQTHKYAGLR